MFPILLNYGKDPKGSNPEDLKAAAEVLKSIRPDVKRFSPSIIDELARGDTSPGGRQRRRFELGESAFRRSENNVGIEVLTPKGMGFWIESWLIPPMRKRRQRPQIHQLHARPRNRGENGIAVTFAPPANRRAKNACRVGEHPFHLPERAGYERRFRHAANEYGCENCRSACGRKSKPTPTDSKIVAVRTMFDGILY